MLFGKDRQKALKRLEGLDDAAIVRRWNEIVSTVRNGLTQLSIERDVMAKTVTLLNQNERFLRHPGRRFVDLARPWYGNTMPLAFRRQTDPDGRSASVRVLLEEMRVNHGLPGKILAPLV